MKKCKYVTSVLGEIAPQVFQITDADIAKAFIKEFITKRNIELGDKNTILSNINKCKNITAVHKYVCNSLLMYEGLSLNVKQ
jgi:hypothetical protein